MSCRTQAHAKRSSNDNNNEENRSPPSSIDVANARTPSSLSSMSGCRRGQQSCAANVSGGGSDLGDSAEDKRVNDARVLISSTHANQHLLSRQLGKLKEIERTVDALEKMMAYGSEEEYRRKMRSAFASLVVPVFETYDTDVVVAPSIDFTSVDKNKRVRNHGENDGDERLQKMKKAVDDNESVEEELYGVDDSDMNHFNKNDVDVEDNVEAEEGVEDEEE